MKEKDSKYTEAKMLIRRPAAQVFQAFIDPAITSNFWFTKGSNKLETNKTVTWEWEMYDVSTTVGVKEIIPTKRSWLNGVIREQWLNSNLNNRVMIRPM